MYNLIAIIVRFFKTFTDRIPITVIAKNMHNVH